MAEIAYDSLPNDQKRKIAMELRPTTKIADLARMLGVGTGTISRWTNPKSAERDRQSTRAYRKRFAGKLAEAQRTRRFKKRTRIRRTAERCNCGADPQTRDSRADAFFKRGATCLYCCKPIKGAK